MSRKPRLLHDDDLRQLLVDRGIRVTVQRLAILRELARLRIPTEAVRNQVEEIQLRGRCAACAGE